MCGRQRFFRNTAAAETADYGNSSRQQTLRAAAAGTVTRSVLRGHPPRNVTATPVPVRSLVSAVYCHWTATFISQHAAAAAVDPTAAAAVAVTRSVLGGQPPPNVQLSTTASSSDEVSPLGSAATAVYNYFRCSSGDEVSPRGPSAV